MGKLFEFLNINKGKHKMPIEVAQKYIDLLLENNEKTKDYLDTRACDAVILDFIGGEPLLEVDLIDEIITYFQKRTIELNHPWQYNWRMSISSNGVLYFKPEVQKFLDKYYRRLSFTVSIDGNKQLHDTCRKYPDGHGSYDDAIAAVYDYRKKYNAYMGSKMTLAPENIKYTFEAVKSLIESDYKEINLNCVYEKGWTIEDATTLYYQLKQLADYLIINGLEEEINVSMFNEELFRPLGLDENQNYCGGDGSMIAADWKGDLYPCIRYMESSLGTNVEPVIIGNVYEGIAPNAKCLNCIQQLKAIDRINQSTEECINCQVALGCGYCQALNYQYSGDFKHRATYICYMHKARSLANVYYWNLKHWKYEEPIRMKMWLPEEEALKIIPKQEYEELKNYQFPII